MVIQEADDQVRSVNMRRQVSHKYFKGFPKARLAINSLVNSILHFSHRQKRVSVEEFANSVRPASSSLPRALHLGIL